MILTFLFVQYIAYSHLQHLCSLLSQVPLEAFLEVKNRQMNKVVLTGDFTVIVGQRILEWSDKVLQLR